MSINDILAKLRHYHRRLMESPIGSEERQSWINIVRELERMKNALAVSETARGA